MSRTHISDLFSTDTQFGRIVHQILRPDATFTTVAVFAVAMYTSAVSMSLLGVAVHSIFFLPAALLWVASIPGVIVFAVYVLYVKAKRVLAVLFDKSKTAIDELDDLDSFDEHERERERELDELGEADTAVDGGVEPRGSD